MTKLTKAHYNHIAKIISEATTRLENRVEKDMVNNRDSHKHNLNYFFNHLMTEFTVVNRWTASEKVQAEIERIAVGIIRELVFYTNWTHSYHVRNKLVKNLCIALTAQRPQFDAELFKKACKAVK